MSVNLSPEVVVDLVQLADALDGGEFDLFVVADGSGSVYREPAGWAAVACDFGTNTAVLHTGTASGGTNNFAELIPFVHALWFDQQVCQKARVSGTRRVLAVTDSEVTVRCGNGQYGRNANRCLWAAVESLERDGYQIRWRHVRRNSNPWNTWMDEMAGIASLFARELEGIGPTGGNSTATG